MRNTPFFAPLQATVASEGSVEGVGVHSGRTVQVTFLPAESGYGVQFVRMDLEKRVVSGNWRSVSSTQLCTTLSSDCGAKVATVEHLMAALWSLGIDNVRIEIDGPEIPILDGSAAPWINILKQLGVRHLQKLAPVIEVLKPVRVMHDNRWLQIVPSPQFEVTLTTFIEEEEQTFAYTVGDSFEGVVAPARTFTCKQNVEALLLQGLGRGASLENAVLIDEGEVVNPEGLRYPDECARHKVLDFIGDWALGGRLFLGSVTGYGAGHTLNHALLRKLLKDPTAWRPFSYTQAANQQKAFEDPQIPAAASAF